MFPIIILVRASLLYILFLICTLYMMCVNTIIDMVNQVQSLCAKTYHLRVLIGNSTSLKEKDGKSIEGSKKECEWIKLPENKRLEKTTVEYEVSVEKCPRYVEVQDMCYFLLDLAAVMKVPTTFEFVSKSRKLGGVGKCLRRILSTQNGVKSAEDYLPLKEQVESALEMVEGVHESLDSGQCSAEDLIKNLKGELSEIKDKEQSMMVLLMTSNYPWGRKGGDQERPQLTKDFVNLLNGYADLPITFVFLVETTDEKIVQFYDSLARPDSDVKADIRVAKSLGKTIGGVAKHNPWLNYCLPLHLCQALGICSNILSQASARPLTAIEVAETCNTCLGGNVPIVADPKADKTAFYSSIESLMSNVEHTAWSPATGKDAPIVDVTKLKKHLSGGVSIGLLIAIVVVIIAILVQAMKFK